MRVEVNGKSVKFCNGWRGVQGGIYDNNSGMLETTENGEMFGAVIYLSTCGFRFAICDRLLTLDELREAEGLILEGRDADTTKAKGAGEISEGPSHDATDIADES